MISIIICSKQPVLDERLSENIRNTIGTDYEVVLIDNSKGQYNIFQAYNRGVELAKGEYLCFMHEDVFFYSRNWGPIVEKHLKNEDIGALGVAGGFVVLNHQDWRFYHLGNSYVRQGYYTIEEHPHYYVTRIPNWANRWPLCQIAVVDGVWMCMRKELFKEIRFDDQTFHSFHMYDTDICFQIHHIGKGVYLTTDVLLEHFSEGCFTDEYLEGLQAFLHKWKDSLPLIRGIVPSPEELEEAEKWGEKVFRERLARDNRVAAIRKNYAAKAQGKPYREFTKEEKRLIEESAYEYRRRCIKDKALSNKECWKCIREYLAIPWAHGKMNILHKFLWHRLILHKLVTYP